MIELCTESSSDSSGRLDWTAVEKAFFPGATVELAAGGPPRLQDGITTRLFSANTTHDVNLKWKGMEAQPAKSMFFLVGRTQQCLQC